MKINDVIYMIYNENEQSVVSMGIELYRLVYKKDEWIIRSFK